MRAPSFFHDNILTLEMIAAEINECDEETAAYLAGYYAFDAARDSVGLEGMSSDDMGGHFEYLIDAGAKFDRSSALVQAEAFKAAAVLDE